MFARDRHARKERLSTGKQIKLHINRLMRSRIGDLIGEVKRYFRFIIFVWNTCKMTIVFLLQECELFLEKYGKPLASVITR